MVLNKAIKRLCRWPGTWVFVGLYIWIAAHDGLYLATRIAIGTFGILAAIFAAMLAVYCSIRLIASLVRRTYNAVPSPLHRDIVRVCASLAKLLQAFWILVRAIFVIGAGCLIVYLLSSVLRGIATRPLASLSIADIAAFLFVVFFGGSIGLWVVNRLFEQVVGAYLQSLKRKE